eukprot:363107-Chlamydomonas_euryale.AAC.6
MAAPRASRCPCVLVRDWLIFWQLFDALDGQPADGVPAGSSGGRQNKLQEALKNNDTRQGGVAGSVKDQTVSPQAAQAPSKPPLQPPQQPPLSQPQQQQQPQEKVEGDPNHPHDTHGVDDVVTPRSDEDIERIMVGSSLRAPMPEI